MSEDSSDPKVDSVDADTPSVQLSDAVKAALIEEVDTVVADSSEDWDGFSGAIWARIDETPEDQIGFEGESLGAALRGVAEVPPPPDGDTAWSTFADAVFARVDESDGVDAKWSSLVELLREDHIEALSAFDVLHEEFNDGFALRWAEHSEASASTVGDVLRSEVDSEVQSKARAWSAFAYQVLAAIDRGESRPTKTVDRALTALRDDFDAEMLAMAPRFDADFREGVERRIFRSATQSKTWWQALGERLQQWLSPEFGFVAVATAVALFTVVSVQPSVTTPDPVRSSIPGRVSISKVEFDGDVMVVPDEGIAVVWMTDTAS
ncbi:MAG: hypothetical protein AAFN74_01585 [Myxococcota bacterium]